MTGQKDLLKAKSFYEILRTAKIHNIAYPPGISPDDMEFLYSLIEDDSDEDDYTLLDHYSDYEIDEADLQRHVEDMAEEDARVIIEHTRAEQHKAEIVMRAMQNRDTLDDLLYEYLLKPENMRQIFSQFSLKAEQHFRNAVNELLDHGRDITGIDLISWERRVIESLEKQGYVSAQKTMYYDSPDERTHITGLRVGMDTARVYRALDTPEYRIEREKENILYDCVFMSVRYYYAAPLSMVIRLYDTVRQKKPYLPAATEDDIRKMPEDFISYQLVDYKGITYIADSFIYSLMNDGFDEEDTAIALEYLEKAAEKDHEYYIPPYEEMMEFFDESYLKSNEPLVKLHGFIESVCLENKQIENIGTNMFMLGILSPEDELHFRKRRYSMDNTEDAVDENFYRAVGMLYEDMSVDDVYFNMNDFYAGLKEEAKTEFYDLLRAAKEYIPQFRYYGYSKKQYEALFPDDE